MTGRRENSAVDVSNRRSKLDAPGAVTVNTYLNQSAINAKIS